MHLIEMMRGLQRRRGGDAAPPTNDAVVEQKLLQGDRSAALSKATKKRDPVREQTTDEMWSERMRTRKDNLGAGWDWLVAHGGALAQLTAEEQETLNWAKTWRYK